jgi:hypothetical protein
LSTAIMRNRLSFPVLGNNRSWDPILPYQPAPNFYLESLHIRLLICPRYCVHLVLLSRKCYEPT